MVAGDKTSPEEVAGNAVVAVDTVIAAAVVVEGTIVVVAAVGIEMDPLVLLLVALGFFLQTLEHTQIQITSRFSPSLLFLRFLYYISYKFDKLNTFQISNLYIILQLKKIVLIVLTSINIFIYSIL